MGYRRRRSGVATGLQRRACVARCRPHRSRTSIDHLSQWSTRGQRGPHELRSRVTALVSRSGHGGGCSPRRRRFSHGWRVRSGGSRRFLVCVFTATEGPASSGRPRCDRSRHIETVLSRTSLMQRPQTLVAASVCAEPFRELHATDAIGGLTLTQHGHPPIELRRPI